jgi:hypothetical protein
MAHIFEVTDKSGRKIRLPKDRWKHIQVEHSRINDPEELKQTLINPLKITSSKYDPKNVRYYYRYNKNLKRYLFVAVKYLNGDGFIVTSFYRRNIE